MGLVRQSVCCYVRSPNKENERAKKEGFPAEATTKDKNTKE